MLPFPGAVRGVAGQEEAGALGGRRESHLAESARLCRKYSKCAFPAVSAKGNSEPETQGCYKFICFVRFGVEAHLKV